LLIVFALSLSVSLRATAWFSAPILLSLNGYVLRRAKTSHRRWVIVGRTERVYIRLFAWRRGDYRDDRDPDVLVFEAAEIASMSIKAIEVFLDGPKPKFVEWLMIEPAQAVGDDISRHIRPLLRLLNPEKAVLVADEEGRLTVEWKWWRPALQVFLQQLARECPSIVIAHEEHSGLDLNGLWRGISRNLRNDLNAQERQKLVQARHLGFGCDCVALLSRYKHISSQEAAAYLEEIEKEETGTENCNVQM
jgi:hypothetical protein